jgi:DNA-nicking Smr family endonuclease
MSKKEKNKLNGSNPFTVLKGLPVSPPHKSSPEKPLPLDPPPPADFTLDPVDEVDQFEQAMSLLGVRQAAETDLLEKTTPRQVPDHATIEPDLTIAESFTPVGSRRHIRKLIQRIGAPETTLDLHGVAAADVIRMVTNFLENAVFHGCRSVRIVTGKGSHSAEGPVLRPLVETYLSGPGRQFIAEWTRAPLQHGGSGALLVLLRQK